MTRTHLVVAVRDREHCSRALNAAAEVLEQIESRLVRPVHVFEHDQGLCSFELIERRRENDVAIRCGELSGGPTERPAFAAPCRAAGREDAV